MKNIISVKGVAFKEIPPYPEINIEEGETVFVTGESGCGKTTLLRLLGGLLSPDRGVIEYKGADISALNPVKHRRDVLLVNQNVFLFEGTIEDNFREYYSYREEKCPEKDEIRKYLEVCCVPFGAEDKCDNMSGGEKQRVFEAVCLSFMPKVLMLDEPTSALDEKNSRQLMENIKAFCKENGITLIVVSHDGSVTQEFADRIIALGGEK